MLPNEYLYYYYHREKALEHILNSEKYQRRSDRENQSADDEGTFGNGYQCRSEEALQTFLYYMQVRENSYMSVESE